MKTVLAITALLLSGSEPLPHQTSLDLIDRALNTPAYVLTRRGDIPDELAGAIDIAYGLNGAEMNPGILALFNDDPEKHGALIHALQKTGMSKDDFLYLSKCLNLLSDPSSTAPRGSCGDDVEYKRLSEAWAQAKTKPVDRENRPVVFEFRVFLDTKWQGTSRCADPTCVDKPVSWEIMHLGPNAYRVIMADDNWIDGYYDPDSQTLTTPLYAAGPAQKMTLHMSPDGTTVTGEEVDADGRSLRSFSLRRATDAK